MSVTNKCLDECSKAKLLKENCKCNKSSKDLLSAHSTLLTKMCPHVGCCTQCYIAKAVEGLKGKTGKKTCGREIYSRVQCFILFIFLLYVISKKNKNKSPISFCNPSPVAETTTIQMLFICEPVSAAFYLFWKISKFKV